MKLEPIITPNPLIYGEFNPKPENVIRQENAVFISNLERNVGRSFIREAETLFSNRRIETFSRESFEHYLNKYVAKIRVDEWLDGSSFLNESIEFQVKIFEDLFSKSCTDTNLETNREELLSWKDKAKKGKALFVNCLMGVGKSYSIVKILGQNPNLSAVIFMPTRKMCETIIQDIKNEIVRRNPNIRSYRQKREQEVEVYDENGNLVTDIIGEPVYEWTREFLEDQVYYVDGINEKECPHFEKIIKRYKYNWIEKKDYCFECENILTCRFRSHVVKACYSRIVVTTHQQYDYFYRKKIVKEMANFQPF